MTKTAKLIFSRMKQETDQPNLNSGKINYTVRSEWGHITEIYLCISSQARSAESAENMSQFTDFKSICINKLANLMTFQINSLFLQKLKFINLQGNTIKRFKRILAKLLSKFDVFFLMHIC